MDLQKKYDAKITESKWQKIWQETKIFKFDNKSDKIPFIVDTPPPTVSGKMHVGHSFSYAQQDFIVRFQRMIGKNVYYPFGTDDNGLPTEKLVEKLKKINSKKMERHEFIKLCDETIKEIKPDFIQDWINIGMSCDFEGSYSTIDPHCQKTSQASFIDLFNKGLLHRQETPVSWCVHCQTAIAQAEFENVDMTSHFNDIVFTCGGKELVIATTRPELLPACVALFYNPEDERYKGLEGKFAKVPLFDYEVPILSDSAVAKDKGSGLMMVCTFGDKEDVEKWHKHKLLLRIIFNKDGTLNDLAGKYKGLKIKEARKEIISDLKEKNILIAQKDITHPVNVHERCGTEVEFLKTPQWYIKVLDKKQEFIDAANKINWYPEHMKIRYIHWVENLGWDWCISRQRHFGIPFPVWYCKSCNAIKLADYSQLPVDPAVTQPTTSCACGCKDFVPDNDVMDTWATSSVTPQIITNWKSQGTYEIDSKHYPCDLRPQAHDIIRTWAFYTIVKGLYNNGEIPWKNIMISGFVLDPKGKKMSKSKGNVIDPRIMIEKYCADALRFGASATKIGSDIPFQEKELVTANKLINKLWNASKFSLMHLEDFNKEEIKLEPFDEWMIAKLQNTINKCTSFFEAYEYSKATQEVEDLFWITFCDNYLEVVKDRLYNPEIRGSEKRKSGQSVLYETLLSILKMFAPIVPYITEEIHSLYFAEKENKKSIHISEWPKISEERINKDSEMAGDLGIDIISAVRKFKSENKVSLKTEIKTLTIECNEEQKILLEKVLEDLKATTKAINVVFSNGDIETEKFGLKVSFELAEEEAK